MHSLLSNYCTTWPSHTSKYQQSLTNEVPHPRPAHGFKNGNNKLNYGTWPCTGMIMKLWLSNKLWSSSDASLGPVTGIHIPLTHRLLIECYHVFASVYVEEVKSLFVKIVSLYVFLSHLTWDLRAQHKICVIILQRILRPHLSVILDTKGGQK